MTRLRACRAVHAPSGLAVTPRMCTRRVATSMANSTYRRLRKIASTVEEIAGQQTAGLVAEECPPGGVQSAGSRPVMAAQDPPERSPR